ncbi:MAG: polysaccharide deacetylase family protein [Jatrophihabitantaceae bacterium]
MDNALLLSGTPRLAAGQVSLTFDDGPGPRTAELAQLLAEQDAPGTFFVLGESLVRYGHVLDAIRDHGHTIALHGEYHRPFRSAEQATDQLAKCRARVAGYLPETIWYRPPYGIGNEPVPGYAGPVGWHAHGRDWEITYRQGQTVTGCVDAILETLVRSQGGIVLLHDFAPFTEFAARRLAVDRLDLRVLEITTLLIERLREHGFTLVGLPDPAAEPLAEPVTDPVAEEVSA